MFTHLLPSGTEHYIDETSRLLASDGRFLSSWFLLTDTAPENSQRKKEFGEFPHHFEHHAQRTLYAPEQAVAYRLDYVENLFAKAGFTIDRVYFGGWSGRTRDVDFGQDIIVARRVDRVP